MYDWKRHKQGNPEEYQVIRVTEDLEVFCNGELEGKIRMSERQLLLLRVHSAEY